MDNNLDTTIPESNPLLDYVKSHKIILGITGIFVLFSITYLIYTYLAPRPYSILSVTPIDNSTDVGPFSSLTVKFDRALSGREQSAVSLKIEPPNPGIKEWVANNTVIYHQTEKLMPSTKYTASISGDRLNYSWSFTTKAEGPLTTKEQEEAQSISDKKFGDFWQKSLQEYPWYNSLPLQTSSYFVYLDIQKRIMIAKLYPTDKTSEQEINSLKKDILTQLQSLGVDTKQVPIEWQIQ